MVIQWVPPLAVLVLLAAPAVAAQASTAPPMELRAQPVPSGFLKPEEGLWQIPVVARIGCSADQAATPNQVRYEVHGIPSFAAAIISPGSDSYSLDPSSCGDLQYRKELKASLSVSLTRQAPALRPFPLEVWMTVKTGGVAPSNTYGPTKAFLNITPDFVALTQVTPDKSFILVEPGGTVAFPVRVTNLGNGPANVSMAIENRTGKALQALSVPAAFLVAGGVEAKANRTNERWVNVTARAATTSGYVNAINTFTLTVATHSADPASTQMDLNKVTLSVQVRGGVLGSPSTAPAGMLLAVTAALAFTRRRTAP